MSENELYQSPLDFILSDFHTGLEDENYGIAHDMKPLRNYQYADYQYEKLIEEIKAFESRLDDDHEVALKLASFGENITISVTHIGYYNPSLIIFDGLVKGNPATLVQHVSQLSFLMIAVKKADPDRPVRRIGFNASSD